LSGSSHAFPAEQNGLRRCFSSSTHGYSSSFNLSGRRSQPRLLHRPKTLDDLDLTLYRRSHAAPGNLSMGTARKRHHILPRRFRVVHQNSRPTLPAIANKIVLRPGLQNLYAVQFTSCDHVLVHWQHTRRPEYAAFGPLCGQPVRITSSPPPKSVHFAESEMRISLQRADECKHLQPPRVPRPNSLRFAFVALGNSECP